MTKMVQEVAKRNRFTAWEAALSNSLNEEKNSLIRSIWKWNWIAVEPLKTEHAARMSVNWAYRMAGYHTKHNTAILL